MSTATGTAVEARFEVGEGAELELHNVAGRVTVRTHDENSITMRAMLHGSDRAVENTEIEQEQTGNRVVIRTKQMHRDGILGHVRGGSMAAVDYDLNVPRGCLLDIHTVSGDVDVQGTGSKAELHSVSGSLDLTDAQGVIELHSVSGDITASNLEGELNANSTSGRVRVSDSALRRFSLHTVSGDMTISTPLSTGESYSVSTVSGSLRLTVPPGTGADVHLSTVSGRIDGTGSVQASGGAGHRSWSGTVGGGGAHLTMNSVSGSLSLLTFDSAQGDEDHGNDLR
jgi:hypothetical protein